MQVPVINTKDINKVTSSSSLTLLLEGEGRVKGNIN